MLVIPSCFRLTIGKFMGVRTLANVVARSNRGGNDWERRPSGREVGGVIESNNDISIEEQNR